MVNEVVKALSPKKEQSYLDVTAGYGGHFQAIAGRTLKPSATVLVDRDSEAIGFLNKNFGSQGILIIRMDYLNASRQLLKSGRQFDMILADLGVSSPHLEKASRGFAFTNDGPLDMRFDQTQELTADKVVNEWQESEIANMIAGYGQEPKARTIAQRIVLNRPIKSTKQLAKIVAGVWRGRSRIHPATRTFQAIRIAVNNELDLLEQSLPLWLELLAPGGRLAVISFHSLEDRLVKQFFIQNSSANYDGQLKLLGSKPINATNEEIKFNPRARSAKLRAAVKIKTKRKEKGAYADTGKR